ncbi:MAG: methyltransferase domain-containing protein [Planctomycetota bacterium]|nr:methyltransferase domain-containing protein [Planctomycetota bacterium]
MKSPLRLPFDVYQRYRLVTDILGRIRDVEGEPLRVLDVGGRTAILREFDQQDRIDLVDLEPLEDVENLVVGNGCKLPFANGSFDAVCAFDTLEHVPPEARKAFVKECVRVARRWVVLAGPYHATRVAQAERILQRFLQEKLGYEHRYLEEHRHYGLPNRKAVEDQLRSLGAEVESVGHANLERWLALMCMSMYMDLDPALRELAGSVFAWYNKELYASDHARPVYRHAVIAALGDAPLPELDGMLAPPRAPKGAVEPFAKLAREMLAFDKERGEWAAVRAAFEQTVSEVNEDLAGHKESLEEMLEDIREKEQHVAEMTREYEEQLAEHRVALAESMGEVELRDQRIEELGEDLDATKAKVEELTHEAAKVQAVAADLEQQVAAERHQVAKRDEEITGLGERIDALEAKVEELRHQVEDKTSVLADREAVLANREQLLAEHREVLAARDVQVAEQQEAIGHLEAHLRDRNMELKRKPMAVLRRVMWLFFGKPPTVE